MFRLFALFLISLQVALSQVFIPCNSSDFVFTGRRVENFASASPSVAFSWPGFQIAVGFTGTSIAFAITSSYYMVLVDGKNVSDMTPQSKVIQNVNGTFYVAISGLAAGNHHVVLGHRPEGGVTFYGVLLDVGARIEAGASLAERRIEIMGDSVSCGFGVLGTPPCNNNASLEDFFSTYHYLTAKAFGASIHAQPPSGAGVVKNPLPPSYPYAEGASGALWNFSLFSPHAIFIDLGPNDGESPDANESHVWVQAYMQYVKTIRASNVNDPVIFLICGPYPDPLICNNTMDVVNGQHALGDKNTYYVNFDSFNLSNPALYGCNGHPSVLGHSIMSQFLIKFIKPIMGW